MKKTLTIAMMSSVLFVAGCSSTHRDTLVGQIDNTRQIVEMTDAEIQELKVLLAQAEDEPIIERIEGGIEVLEAKKARFQERLLILEQALADAPLAEGETFGNALIIGSEAGKVGAPFLPPPFDILLFGGLSVVGAIGTELNRRRAKAAVNTTTEIVKAVEVAKTASPAAPEGVVDFNDEVTKTKMKTVLSPKSRETINKIRGK